MIIYRFISRTLAVLIFVLFFVNCNKIDQNQENLKVIEDDINKKIKVGSTKESVIILLNFYKIEHSEYSKEKIIYAIIRPRFNKSVIHMSIQMIFLFNDNDELIKYESKEIFTGP